MIVKFREVPLTALMKEIGTELIDNRICRRHQDIQARFNWKIGGDVKEDWHEFREYSSILVDIVKVRERVESRAECI